MGARAGRRSDYGALITRLRQIKAAPEDGDALDEAMDIIHDYALAAAQAARMTEKYETGKAAIFRGMEYYQCPDCAGRVHPEDAHCRHCGRKLGWIPSRMSRGKGGKPRQGRRRG